MDSCYGCLHYANSNNNPLKTGSRAGNFYYCAHPDNVSDRPRLIITSETPKWCPLLKEQKNG